MRGGLHAWLPLAPAAVISAYWFVGFAIFSIRSAISGVRHDRELEARGRSILIGNFLKSFFSWIMRPLWLVVLASGISPNGITLTAMLLGGAAGIAVGTGRFALGGWLFLLSGILDTFDGRLARTRNAVTPAGGAFDSLLDRYADGAMMIGLAFYFRASWVLIPALAAIFGTSMVPYVRAKAESFGITMRDGLMQRPERVLTLGVAVAFSPWVEGLWPSAGGHPSQRLAAISLVILAVTSNATAVGRIVRLLAALRKAGPAPTPIAATTAAGKARPAPARARLVRT